MHWYSSRLINSNALLSLQIIKSESHPSMLNQGPSKKSSSSKEGLSVYGVFQRFACSPQGRNRLRQDLLRPSTNIDVIRERHDFLSVLLRPDNLSCLEKITKSLKHVKDLRPVMINLRKGISTESAKVTGFKTTVWATLLAVCVCISFPSALSWLVSLPSTGSTSTKP